MKQISHESFIPHTIEGIDEHSFQIKKRLACFPSFKVAISTPYTLDHSQCWFDLIIKLRPAATDPEFCRHTADDPGTRVHGRCR